MHACVVCVCVCGGVWVGGCVWRGEGGAGTLHHDWQHKVLRIIQSRLSVETLQYFFNYTIEEIFSVPAQLPGSPSWCCAPWSHTRTIRALFSLSFFSLKIARACDCVWCLCPPPRKEVWRQVISTQSTNVQTSNEIPHFEPVVMLKQIQSQKKRKPRLMLGYRWERTWVRILSIRWKSLTLKIACVCLSIEKKNGNSKGRAICEIEIEGPIFFSGFRKTRDGWE